MLNQSAQSKTIKLTNQIKKDVCVYADKDMLSTVIRNLISNAIKFTHKGGDITIDSSFIKDKKNQRFTEISIIDNGVRISKETQSKLFDISESTSTRGTDNESGTGLGLMLCKEFVEKHKGKIRVESKIEKGSSFYFTIPDKK